MKTLAALAVQGESYLLLTRGKTVLVDGGYSAKKLVAAMRSNFPTLKAVDVVLCTHADEDHAQGLVGLLDTGAVNVGEFWLPGSWADVTKDLLERPVDVFKRLIEEVKSDPRAKELIGSDEEDIDRLIAAMMENAPYSPTYDGETMEGEAHPLDAHPAPKTLAARAAANARRAAKELVVSQEMRNRILSLIDTADRVRKIALSAIEHGVPVRWFDYRAYAKIRTPGGGESFLRPVNSRELIAPPPLNIFFMRTLQLTRVNRECLVFLSPSEDGHMSVLFTGDSPLGDGPGYTCSFLNSNGGWYPLVATAPHHGSDSNAIAYSHIAAWHAPAYWVRSGGGSSHPGNAYRRIEPGRRTCTRCPHLDLPVRQVTIVDGFGDRDPEPWFTIRSHDCVCAP